MLNYRQQILNLKLDTASPAAQMQHLPEELNPQSSLHVPHGAGKKTPRWGMEVNVMEEGRASLGISYTQKTTEAGRTRV